METVRHHRQPPAISTQMHSKHHTIIRSEVSGEDAIVYLESEMIETSTEKQLQAMLLNGTVSHCRVMPDCHVGHGCCVGFTAHVDPQKVVPAFVGGDIGCGILTYPIDKKRLNLERIESVIRRIIPVGGGQESIHAQPPVEESFISRYLARADADLKLFASRFELSHFDNSTIDYDYFLNVCDRIRTDVNHCMRSFGTLGSGNHFIEINQDDSNGQYYLTIHSGSRSFGMKLFEYHNAKIDAVRGEEKCLKGADALDYCKDLLCAQHLAIMNRHIMLQLILRELDMDFDCSRIIESVHNYIDFSVHPPVLRKGAISAAAGEMCIVALNMRDGIILCRGRGNPEWNCSCAHGCGRIMSRSEARRRIKLKEFKKVMRDVVTTSVCENTLDESPQAYKDMNVIIDALAPTAEVVVRLCAVMNVKGMD
jgi:tRNA-splicing ligase RtcB (3'-phosphate/5'-hydroxy nucleic acid ligase)